MKISQASIGLLFIGILLSGTGCSYQVTGESKKIVVDEDVRETLKEEKNVQVSVEQIDLPLAEGEYFWPLYYDGDELYGKVHNGIGVSDPKDDEVFPVLGSFKAKLYQLDQMDNLTETMKPVIDVTHRNQFIGESKLDGNIVSIDYLTDTEPTILPVLTEKLKTIKPYNNLTISEPVMCEGKELIKISNGVNYVGYLLYFYDIKEDKFYQRKEQIYHEADVVYLEALEGFIRMDEEGKLYQVVFEEDRFDFKEYMDLGHYIQKAEDHMLTMAPLNEEEIVIWESSRSSEDGFPLHTTYSKMSKFNLLTNEYQVCWEAEEAGYYGINEIGNIPLLGGYVYIFERYMEEEGLLQPQERVFKVLEGDEMRTVFVEDIKQEGPTLNQLMLTAFNEQAHELFIYKDITYIVNGIETSRDAIYKKYTFK